MGTESVKGETNHVKKLLIAAGILVAGVVIANSILRKIEVQVTHEDTNNSESASDSRPGRPVGLRFGIQSDSGLRLLSRTRYLPEEFSRRIEELINDPESWISRGRPERKDDDTV